MDASSVLPSTDATFSALGDELRTILYGPSPPFWSMRSCRISNSSVVTTMSVSAMLVQFDFAVFVNKVGREAHTSAFVVFPASLQLCFEIRLQASERFFAVETEAVRRHDQFAQVSKTETFGFIRHSLKLFFTDVVLQDVVEVRLACVGDRVVETDDKIKTTGTLDDAVF